MNFVLHPEERSAFFDGWKTDDANFAFSCAACGTEIVTKFSEMLTAAWSWKEKTEAEERQAIAEICGIDLARRSIANGMDAVVRAPCPKCGAEYFAHFWFHEYRHSCYSISVRAVVSR